VKGTHEVKNTEKQNKNKTSRSNYKNPLEVSLKSKSTNETSVEDRFGDVGTSSSVKSVASIGER
jgi:hypothetical protein